MLWTLVFEFFVKYVFGGILYDNNIEDVVYYDAFVGGYINANGDNTYLNTYEYNLFSINSYGIDYPMNLGNYLSLIATIISMVAIVLICCALIKKIYNMCAHIIG